MRYFFNVTTPEGHIRDLEGSELPDLDAVREEARESAKELLQMVIANDAEIDHRRFEIVDDTGKLVLSYRFLDAIRL